MKTLIQKTLIAFVVVAIATAFTACKKDQSCGVHINVVDKDGIKQKNTWVIIDWAPGVPPTGTKSSQYPIQLNTGRNGYVDCNIKLEGIPYAYVYDSANYQFIPPAIGGKPLKLVPGETISVDIPIN